MEILKKNHDLKMYHECFVNKEYVMTEFGSLILTSRMLLMMYK